MKRRSIFFPIHLFLLSVFCLFQLPFALAEEMVTLNDDHPEQKIGKSIYYLKDKTQKLTFEQISSPEYADKFVKCEQEAPNFGNIQMTVWNKFTVVNQSSKSWVFFDSFYNVDTLTFYYPDSSGKYHKVLSGSSLPLSSRKYRVNPYVFDLPFAGKDTVVYYLKVDAYIFQYPVIVSTQENFIEQNHYHDIFLGIYFGFVLLIILYNISIYITVRDKNYLIYVVYVLLVGMFVSSQQGLNAYFWGDKWHTLMWGKSSVITALMGISSFYFAKSFLETKTYAPTIDRIFIYGFIPLNILIIFIKLMGFHLLATIIIQISGLIAVIFFIVTSVLVYRRGYKPARFYLIATGLYLIGVIVYTLKTLGLLPYSNFTNDAMLIGSAFEMTMFSISLADKINIFKKEKEKAQVQYLDTLHENERLTKEQNKILEQKVTERTSELEHTLENLRKTQAQLVQSEKLVSLGLLTAGIAHEINNPINFVSASVPSLKRNFEDVKSLITEIKSIKVSEEQRIQLDELFKQLDINATLEETEILLNGISDGANRTSIIVKDLQSFSRIDDKEMKTANLHYGIDSTLALLKNKITDSIEVIMDYGNIPPIKCYEGQLNQVFMNVLNNAIDAIPGKGTITVKTRSENGFVKIYVTDSGVGMSEEVKKKIFDPFFTTKDVGKGTGLGLAVSYGIIERHGGTIEVKSEQGKGTEFIISLPVK